jgi:signal transduction histidine kinase/ActR/RegA family two-component response regulator
MKIDRFLRISSRPHLAAILLLIFLLDGLGLWLAAKFNYNRTYDRAQTILQKTATSLDERMKRTVTATDMVLKYMVDEIQQKGIKQITSSREEWERFRKFGEALPDVGSLWLLDHKADLLLDSTQYPSQPMSFADREYYGPHRDKGIESYIGPVVKGRITKKYSFTITRRINKNDGGFAGILVAAIETDDFTNFLQNLGIGEKGAVTIWRIDGKLILRQPMEDRYLSKDFSHLSLFKISFRDSSSGVLHDAQGVDGVERLAAYQKIQGLPLVAVTSIPIAAIRQVWVVDVKNYILIALFTLGGLMGLTCLVYRSTAREDAARRELEIAHEQVTRLNSELEQRVQERTVQLVAANRDLNNENIQRRQAEEALRESRAKLEAALASMTEAIFIADGEGQFTDFNDAFVRYYRFQGKEECSKAIAECPNYIDAYFEDGTPAPLDMWAMPRALRGETGSNIDYMLRRKDTGETWWGSYSFGPIKDNDNRIVGAVVCAREITARKRMEEELRRSHDQLELRVQERTADLARANKELKEEIARREKAEQQLLQAQRLESIGTLTGGIAHDINNILGPIVINSEMALMDLPKESGVRNYLELILKSGLRGKDLVRQMLLFSRKSEKKQEVLPLSPLIKETFKLLRSSLPTTIHMRLILETESDAVYADPSQVQQVIINLCTNAAYAMRGTTGSIELSLQAITFGSTDLPEADMQPGDYLVLSVKDTGAGMEEEVRKRVFEPFFTTKPVGEGTGLGLSVVYGIVKSHRGRITVYSEPGRGSIFRVYLPKAETRVLEKAEAPKPIPKGKERILFVDDEEIIVKSVQNMLEHLGYNVTAAMDSEEALKLFSGKPSEFDLVMTDQTMPAMTGEDLGKELMRIRPDIPVILCTGYSDLISSEKAIAMGFRGFIMKPFTLRESAELVRRVLDQKVPGNK